MTSAARSTTRSRPPEALALRLLAAADAACNRLYGWRGNPLYQSGTIVVLLLLVLLATGVWLTLFYRVGAPWESVARITANPWWGNWVRGVHRYASDAAVVAIGVHALRMFAQGRSWGPRALAWISGVLLLLMTFVSGWTGYVMVWDVFGEALAREGARMLDALPVLSEPISRAFTGERPLPGVFFFINLFAHVGVPLGMLVLLWLHTSRVARPALLPPRPVQWAVLGALVALAIAAPMTMAAKADPMRVVEVVPADWFYAFWMPWSQSFGGGAAFAGAAATLLGALAVPLLFTRRRTRAPAPSVVNEDLCTGCRQCALDCPYEAIAMQPRADASARSREVARVNPALCVSCGICAGSCAPMGVGPAGRTGRDQLAAARAFLARPDRARGEIVAVCCDRGIPRLAPALAAEGAVPYPVDCAGSLHTSVIELLLRGGSAGVFVLACPPRDCWNREGPTWLAERVYHDREAELQSRVDRRRVCIAHAGASEALPARAALRDFAMALREMELRRAETDTPLERECEPAWRAVPRASRR